MKQKLKPQKYKKNAEVNLKMARVLKEVIY